MARSAAEIAKLIGDAWDLYEHVPRVTQSADLHAAAFASGSIRVVTVNEKAEIQTHPVQAADGLLRQIGVDLYVAGSSRAKVDVVANAIVMSPGEGCAFSYKEMDPHQPPGAVWVPAVNHDLLLNQPHIAAALGVDLMQTMVRPELLSTEAASNTNPAFIAQELFYFESHVRQMRQEFGFGLSSRLEERFPRVLDVSWDGHLRGPGKFQWPSMFEMGRLYSLFKAEGVDLVSLRAAVEGSLNALVDQGLLSKATRTEILDSFSG